MRSRKAGSDGHTARQRVTLSGRRHSAGRRSRVEPTASGEPGGSAKCICQAIPYKNAQSDYAWDLCDRLLFSQMMRSKVVLTRFVTLVTLLAMFAFGASTAYGAGACMLPDTSTLPEGHDHGQTEPGTPTPEPCQHASQSGPCASATMPASSVSFSVATPTTYVARFAEAPLAWALHSEAVFHPPRF